MPLAIKFGEGKYDNTVAKVRAMTNAQHALTLVLGGDRGDGFAVHVGGTTRETRLANTRRLIVAIAQLTQALMNGVKHVEGISRAELLDLTAAEHRGETPTIELQPSPARCAHCGGTLPPVAS